LGILRLVSQWADVDVGGKRKGAVGGLIELEVDRPHMVRTLCRQP
jgi:hypothetical protein